MRGIDVCIFTDSMSIVNATRLKLVVLVHSWKRLNMDQDCIIQVPQLCLATQERTEIDEKTVWQGNLLLPAVEEWTELLWKRKTDRNENSNNTLLPVPDLFSDIFTQKKATNMLNNILKKGQSK